MSFFASARPSSVACPLSRWLVTALEKHRCVLNTRPCRRRASQGRQSYDRPAGKRSKTREGSPTVHDRDRRLAMPCRPASRASLHPRAGPFARMLPHTRDLPDLRPSRACVPAWHRLTLARAGVTKDARFAQRSYYFRVAAKAATSSIILRRNFGSSMDENMRRSSPTSCTLTCPVGAGGGIGAVMSS
jgi:hypothetical protein